MLVVRAVNAVKLYIKNLKVRLIAVLRKLASGPQALRKKIAQWTARLSFRPIACPVCTRPSKDREILEVKREVSSYLGYFFYRFLFYHCYCSRCGILFSRAIADLLWLKLRRYIFMPKNNSKGKSRKKRSKNVKIIEYDQVLPDITIQGENVIAQEEFEQAEPESFSSEQPGA
jgi:hypothetical protein